jgi:ketosteroid isomerase-like protein
MPQNSPAQMGRDAITEANKTTFSMFDASIALNSEETKVAGNWAFDRGKYMLHLMPKTGNDMVMEQGKYVVILQKGADGAWKLAREIGNADEAPPPPPAPAPTAKRGAKPAGK